MEETIKQGKKLFWQSVLIKACPLVWIVTLIAVLSAKWDKMESLDSQGQYPYKRGDLPDWAIGFQTPDERLPGGTYEPTVQKRLEKFGKVITSWMWITWRNAGHGFRMKYARPSDEASYNVSTKPMEGTRPDGTWWKKEKIGPFIKQTGHRIYKFYIFAGPSDPGPVYYSVPTWTIKKGD